MNFAFNGTRLLSQVAQTFWIAFGVSGIFAYPVYRLLIAAKSRQTVSAYLGEAHQKKQGTPTMGGLIILVGVLAALLFNQQYALVGLVLGFSAIGFVDDFLIPRLIPGKRGLGWGQKLVLQFAIAICFFAYVVSSSSGHGLCNILGALNIFALSFLLVAYVNAYNFADGLDALAGGLLLVLTVGMIIFMLPSREGTWPAILTCAAMGGGVIPFLFLNAPPAKLFMGDVGSLPIGALLGYCFTCMINKGVWSLGANSFWDSSTLVQNSTYLAAIFILSFVLFIELVLVPLQIACVKIFKRRLPIRTPIHHSFEYWGWPESRILWCFLLVQVLLCVVALTILQVGVLK